MGEHTMSYVWSTIKIEGCDKFIFPKLNSLMKLFGHRNAKSTFVGVYVVGQYYILIYYIYVKNKAFFFATN